MHFKLDSHQPFTYFLLNIALLGLPSADCIKRPIVVATTHCTWDPDYCDVKLIQSIMLMSELQNFVEKSSQLLAAGSSRYDCANMPMIVAGDFNSTPESGRVLRHSSHALAANSTVSVGVTRC